MKYILILAFTILAFPVMGSGYHQGQQGEPGKNGESIEGPRGKTGPAGNSIGIATAIATSQLNFDWGTYDLQGSCGYGLYNSSNALSCGLGQRFGKILVNGSIGSESGTDKYSAGAGINWRF